MKNSTQSPKKPCLNLKKITVIALDKSEMGKVWGGGNIGIVGDQSTRPECDVTNPITTTQLAR